MYRLKTASKFDKLAQKLPSQIKKALGEKLKRLEKDPNHPSLRTKKNHKATAQAKETIFESSINKQYRILWKYEGKEVILLLIIGDHTIVE